MIQPFGVQAIVLGWSIAVVWLVDVPHPRHPPTLNFFRIQQIRIFLREIP